MALLLSVNFRKVGFIMHVTAPNREFIYYICDFNNGFTKEQWYTTSQRLKVESIIEAFNLPSFPELQHIHLGICEEFCNSCLMSNVCKKTIKDVLIGFPCVTIYDFQKEKQKHLEEVFNDWTTSGILTLKQAISECKDEQELDDLNLLLHVILSWVAAYQHKCYETSALI